MKKIYLFLFCIFLALPVFAQEDLENMPPAQLKQKIRQSQPDSNRVIYQLALGRSILFKPGGDVKEKDSARYLAITAEKLSRQISYRAGVTNGLLLSALVYNKTGLADKGLRAAQQAQAYAKAAGDLNGIAESDIIIGQHYSAFFDNQVDIRIKYYMMASTIFREQHNYLRLGTTLKDIADLLNIHGKRTEAVKILFEALNIYKAIGYDHVQGIYWLIGNCSSEFGDYPSALKYDLLAIKTANSVRDTSLQLCSIYFSTAITCHKINDDRHSVDYALKALQIAKHYKDGNSIATVTSYLCGLYAYTHQLKQALYFLKQAQQMMQGQGPDDRYELTIMGNYVLAYQTAKQYSNAAPYAERLVTLANKLKPDDMTLLVPYNNLIIYYVATRQISKAYHYLEINKRMAQQNQSAVISISAERDYYQLDSIRGNYRSALQHFRMAQAIRDSLYGVTKAYQVSLLQIENDTEQKENDILALTRQTQLKDNELKHKQTVENLVIAATISLLIIVILLYSRYRIKQRSNILLKAQKAEIDQQYGELKDLVADKNELLGEKDLLLKEVNHRVKNNLQMIMSLLESQSAYLDNEAAQGAIIESQNRVQALALIHQKLYQIDNVTDVNMKQYISELVSYLDNFYNTNERSISIQCNVEDIDLDVSQAIPIGLILNEAITNSIKHAFKGKHNGEIHILFSRPDGKKVALSVSDNGVGLSTTGAKDQSSLGMILIKGLTKQLNGKLVIAGKNGLTISVEFSTEALTKVKKSKHGDETTHDYIY